MTVQERQIVTAFYKGIGIGAAIIVTFFFAVVIGTLISAWWYPL